MANKKFDLIFIRFILLFCLIIALINSFWCVFNSIRDYQEQHQEVQWIQIKNQFLKIKPNNQNEAVLNELLNNRN